MAAFAQLWDAAALYSTQNAATSSLLAVGLTVLLLPRVRKLVWDTVETILASIMLVILVLIVLGLPFGATYITFKGAVFVLKSLAANFPYLRELADMAMHSLKR